MMRNSFKLFQSYKTFIKRQKQPKFVPKLMQRLDYCWKWITRDLISYVKTDSADKHKQQIKFNLNNEQF